MGIEVLAPREVMGKQKSELTERMESVMAAFLLNFPSKGTATEYARSAKEFLAFVAPQVRSIEEIRRDHIIFYKKHLTNRGLSNKTILKKLSAISSLCKFLAHEGMVDRDLTYGIRRPKTYNKKETAALTEEEVTKIFASLNPKAYGYYAHRAILATGFYTGLRSSEIRNLKIGDICEAEGHKIIKTIIKGDKPHEVPINPTLFEYLKDHVTRLSELGFECEKEDYLFPRLKPRENKPISGKSLRQILNGALKRAGIQKSDARRYSPHTMRATVATHLLNKVEAPLEEVQRLLGHSNPSTTQKYNKRTRSHERSPIYEIDF